MVAVTYGVARVPSTKGVAKAKRAEKAVPQKSWFTRFMDALIESRMQQARREIARLSHLLPYSVDERGNGLVKSGSENLPFGGW